MNPRKRLSKFAPAVRIAATLVLAAAPAAHAETLATVNGIDIDSNVVDFYLQGQTQRPASEASQADRETALNELIDIYLLATQPEAARLAEDPQFRAQLELQEKGAIAQIVIQDFLANNQATEEEIVAEYESQKAMVSGLQYKASHILVESQAAATALIAELHTGADFAELAKAHSTGPSGPNGGDLGWFSAEQMVPEFSAAVAELEDGEFSNEPVQTQFGWHVIYREASRKNEAPPLDSVRGTVKQRVEQMKIQQYLERLREERSKGDS